MVVKQIPSSEQQHGGEDVDFDGDSEAAVERWLTSPAASSRGFIKMSASPANKSGFGTSRHSHTGTFSPSEVDSAARSMSLAAAIALSESRSVLSSPGGQNNNDASAAPVGRAILRERLRQRVLKHGGNPGRVFDKLPTVDSSPRRSVASMSQQSAVSVSSSVTPQYRLEPAHNFGLASQESNKQNELLTPSTSSSASSHSNSDALKSFLPGDLLKVASSVTDGGKSTRSDPFSVRRDSEPVAIRRARSLFMTKNATKRRSESQTAQVLEDLKRDMESLGIRTTNAPRAPPPSSSPRERRKSTVPSTVTGSVSAPSSPRRKSLLLRARRRRSNGNATQGSETSSIGPQEAGIAVENNADPSVVPTIHRVEKKRFFGSSDSMSASSGRSRDSFPLQKENGAGDTNVTLGSKVTDSSTGTLLSLREVKTFSPKHLANASMAKPKQVPSNMVVESREQAEITNDRLRRQVKYEQRQSYAVPVRSNRVRLHIYDLIASETVVQLPWGCNFPIGQCFSVVNSSLHQLGTGAYHVGVEVNGIEYAYGSNDARNTTGVFTCMPKNSPGYQYRTTIDFGSRTLVRTAHISEDGKEIRYTRGSKDGRVPQGFREVARQIDGREVLREMAREYMGTDYDLLRKNCCTFAHDAAIRLGVKENEVPSWFRNLCQAGALTQDAAVSTMEPLSKVFSSCDCDIGDELPEYVENAGFEVISNEKIASTRGRGVKPGVQTSDSSGAEDDGDLSSESRFRRTSSWRY